MISRFLLSTVSNDNYNLFTSYVSPLKIPGTLLDERIITVEKIYNVGRKSILAL